MLIVKYILTAIPFAAMLAAAYLLARRGGRGDGAPGGARRALPILGGAAMGLLFFFLIQSAVERRIGWDLFLPVREGEPLPGRAALLCVCVVLCLAAALTERGRTLRRRLENACGREWGRWVAAAAVAVLFFLWTLRVTVLSYMTNDDISIIRAIAAIPERGVSAASQTYSNILFCAMLGFFYKLDPDVYWYLGYHLAMLLISITVIGRCILTKLRRSGRPLLYGCLIQALLCAAAFTYTFARLSFTVTPAAAGAAAIALILCRSDVRSIRGYVLTDVFSTLLMILCNLQRHSTGRALLCFWALAAAYHLLKLLLRRDGRRWMRLLLFAPCIAATLCFATITSPAGLKDVDPEYSEADYYRLIVTDYLMNSMTAEKWESVGIPAELGNMIRSWYFMDERVNVDTFRELVELYYDGSAEEADSGGGMAETVRDFLASAKSYVNSTMRPLIAGILLLFLIALWRFLRFGKGYWPEALCALCAVGGFVLLAAYLIWNGRFPLRVFFVLEIPTVVTLLLMDTTTPDEAAEEPRRSPVLSGLTAACIAGLCVCGGIAAKNTPHIREYATHDTVFAEQTAIESYVNSYPDISFYTNLTSNNLDPLHSASYPSNMALWGHVGTLGYKNRLYADAFFRDDIRLMYEQPSTILAFFQYMTLDNGPVGAVIEAQVFEDIYAANVFQTTPGEDYTGWYEQNGLTYYFLDGEAVTGTQVIDGAEYTFAPPGAAAKLVVLPGTDGQIIYTTDAYSLVSDGD